MKDIHIIQEQVHKIAFKKGWHKNKDRTFGDLIALAHSEVSEAFEAYCRGEFLSDHGILEELSDIVIRLLDTLALYKRKSKYQKGMHERVDLGFTFPYLFCRLHKHLSLSLEAYRDTDPHRVSLEKWNLALDELDNTLILTIQFMQAIIDYYLPDSKMEPFDYIWEKVDYNRTRPVRHGGKRI